jgi:hypothetical protein
MPISSLQRFYEGSSLERLIPFVSNPFDIALPDASGSATLGTWTSTGPAATWQNDNPPGASTNGSVRFQRNTTSGNTRISTTSNSELTPFFDKGFTLGFWLKVSISNNSTSNAEGTFQVFTLSGADTSPFVRIGITGASATTPRRIAFSTKETSGVLSGGPAINNGSWYYFQMSRNVAANKLYFYINGNYVSEINTTAATTNITAINIGSGGAGASTISDWFQISNLHWTTDTIDPFALQFFAWPIGNTLQVDDTIIETPATGDSLLVLPAVSPGKSVDFSVSSIITTAILTNPTIVIVNYDSVQITTSTTASSLLVNPQVFVEINTTFQTTPALASLDAEQHLLVLGTGFVDFAEPATSDALLVYPAYAGSPDRFIVVLPFIANADMGPAQNTTPQNYVNIVKQDTPSLFITNPRDVVPTNNELESYQFENSGYDNWGTTAASNVQVFPVNAPGVMLAIGNGKAIYKTTAVNTGTNYIEINNASALSQSEYLNVRGNNFTVEHWFNPSSALGAKDMNYLDFGSLEVGHEVDTEVAGTYSGRNNFCLTEVKNSYRAVSGFTLNYAGTRFVDNNAGQVFASNACDSGAALNIGPAGAAAANAPTDIIENEWNHLVITGTWSGNNLTVSFFHNGEFKSSSTKTIAEDGTQGAGLRVFLANNDVYSTRYYVNQIAVYKKVLSNAAILEHYNHIATSSPNRNVGPAIFESSADLVDPVIVAQVNNNYPEIPVTANADLVDPVIVVETNISNLVLILEASADSVIPSFFGDPDAIILADAAVATADIPQNVYRLDTAYYTYVQTNIAPFRFVTFDSPTPNVDYGSDNDFGGAAPFVYSGIITSSINGLNNNSLITDPALYTTSGLIMKESEHDDDWGTTSKNWHTSFWIKKDISDTNNNGLRIIANLNSYFDNKHIVVYQYNNYIYMQVDDKDVAPQTFISSVTANVFDYNRHHIVIASKNDNKIQIYKNALKIMDVDLGSSDIITINNEQYWAPNTEVNNQPRFSVGALITPYAETNLPLIPTSSTMLVDDAHWALTTINQSGVTGLYSAMPYKLEIDWLADSALNNNGSLVNPSFGTGTSFVSPLIDGINAELINPTVTADFESINVATILDATAEAIEIFSVIADTVTDIVFNADFAAASAEFLDAVVKIEIPGPTMYATARMPSSSPYFDEYSLLIIKQSRMPLGTTYGGRWSVGDVDS